MQTLEDQLVATRNRPSGFDYLRIILSVSVIAWHSIIVCYGRSAETPFWTGPLRPLPLFIVPSFFALSGFLVAGSMERNDLPSFLTLRVLRILPALFVEILLSALIIGPLLTTLTWGEYYQSPMLYEYFENVIGNIHYLLPGVFHDVPAGPSVNQQLWTVPLEFKCYICISGLFLIGLYRRPALLFVILLAGCLFYFSYQTIFSKSVSNDSGPPGRMVILCFLFGVNLYTLRNRTPRHFGLFVLSLGMAWIFLLFRQTCYLAALPVAYTTVYAGLLNPPRTRVMLGADYSYGIYLYGFPVQQTIVYLFPGSRLWIINFFGSVLISGFCAFLSWNLLEAKIMSKRKSVLALVGRITMLIIGVKSRVWQRLETGANLPRF